MKLSDMDLLFAAKLWNVDNDTAEIAFLLDVPEATVTASMESIKSIARCFREHQECTSSSSFA